MILALCVVLLVIAVIAGFWSICCAMAPYEFRDSKVTWSCAAVAFVCLGAVVWLGSGS